MIRVRMRCFRLERWRRTCGKTGDEWGNWEARKVEMKIKSIKPKGKTWLGSAARQTAGAFSFVLETKKNTMRYNTIEVEQ